MKVLNKAVKNKLIEVILNEDNTIYLDKNNPNYTFVVKDSNNKKIFIYKHTQKTDEIIVNKEVVATALPHTLSADMREVRQALVDQLAQQEEREQLHIALNNMTVVDKRTLAFLNNYCKTK